MAEPGWDKEHSAGILYSNASKDVMKMMMMMMVKIMIVMMLVMMLIKIICLGKLVFRGFVFASPILYIFLFFNVKSPYTLSM